jgi:hypothetical protein
MKRALLLLTLLVAGFCNLFAQTNNETWFEEAKPCWLSGKQKEFNYVASFHKSVDLQSFDHARFRIAACSNYRFYLNGEFVGFGPSITAHGFFRVDEYDLSSKLLKGTNVLAIEVCGNNVDCFSVPNQSAFIQAELVVDGEVVAATVPSAKPYAFVGAHTDQRQQVVITYPWQHPHLEAYKLTPDYAHWRKSKDFILKKRAIEQTDAKALLPRGVAYPKYDILNAEIAEDGLISLEGLRTGFIMMDLNVAKPSKIHLYWDEILVDGQLSKSRTNCKMSMDLELAPGKYSFETFEPYTLKYARVKVVEGECSLEKFSMRQYINSETDRVKFETDDKELNQVFNAAVRTFEQNAVDFFMDCPERERAGWLCDSYFTGRSAHYLTGNTKIEHNFIENFVLPAKFHNIPEGMLPMCYPSDHKDGNFIPNWAMWLVLELEEYVQRSGDHSMVARLQPRVMGLLKYFSEFENEDGLLENLAKWVFVEWSKANDYTNGVNYPTNMLYAKMLDVIGRIYYMPELCVKAEKIHETIRKQAYVDGFFRDHALRNEEGRLVVKTEDVTETCQNYAFYLGTATPELYPELWRILTTELGPVRKINDRHPSLGHPNAFIGNYLRIELLSHAGLTQNIIDESKALFVYMAKETDTLWENVTASASCCHGFASHAAYVYIRDIAGLASIDKENRTILVRLGKNSLKYCKATVPVGNEEIVVNWTKKGKKIDYQIEVPAGYKVYFENCLDLNPLVLTSPNP